MVREILKIDEALCNGCGVCVPNCHEGALKVIDDKVRLISELMCDGLGACIGHCSQGAIEIEKREAEPYNEPKVLEKMYKKGKNTMLAHLKHLKDHGETGYLREGVEWLKANSEKVDFNVVDVISEVHNHKPQSAEQESNAPTAHHLHNHGGGCPGSMAMVINKPTGSDSAADVNQPSELRQWPVQLHLVNPNAPYFRNSDLLLAADCVAFSMGAFHSKYLKNKSLAIACPKLDRSADVYIAKLSEMIETAKINTITVMIMEVPCCGGLLETIKAALANSFRKIPVKKVIVGLNGDVLQEEWQ